MKKLLIGTAMLMLIGTAALAQPPVEITADDTLDLRVGQSKTFQFDKPVRDFFLASEDVVAVHVLSDRVHTLTGIKPGSTLAIAYGTDGREIDKLNLTVEGQFVKIYRPGAPDYTQYVCDSHGCGRANTDLVLLPSSEAVTTTTNPDGSKGPTSVTKTYP